MQTFGSRADQHYRILDLVEQAYTATEMAETLVKMFLLTVSDTQSWDIMQQLKAIF